MATTYNNAQIGVVDASGNLNVIYPITKATNVAYKSTNVDTVLTSLSNNKASKKWTFKAEVGSVNGYTTIPSSASEILIRYGNLADRCVKIGVLALEFTKFVMNDKNVGKFISNMLRKGK